MKNEVSSVGLEKEGARMFKDFLGLHNVGYRTGINGRPVQVYGERRKGDKVDVVIGKCKRYLRGYIDVDDIRELKLLMVSVGAYHGFFFTTNNYTEEAIELSRKNKIDLIQVVGTDRGLTLLKWAALAVFGISIGLFTLLFLMMQTIGIIVLAITLIFVALTSPKKPSFDIISSSLDDGAKQYELRRKTLTNIKSRCTLSE